MTIEDLKAKMQEYFRDRKNAMQARARELRAQGQDAAAELEMGRLAVYDVFGTMLAASALKAKMNPKYASGDRVQAFIQEYLMAFITQPAEWRLKYAQAKERGEEGAASLEWLRLETVREIKDEFLRISKGESM